MRKEEFISLVQKYQQGKCSLEEQKLILEYCEEIQRKGTPPQWDLNEEEETSIRILTIINKKIDQFEIREGLNRRNMTIYPNAWSVAWKVAAVLILISGIFAWFISTDSFTDKESSIEYLTKKTEKGQKATIKLPDGSTVRLNSESSITYASTLNESETRRVMLSGEAFFNVVENKQKPFIIKTGQINTEVLGTTFNINAYPEKTRIQVTLETGKVKVETNENEGIIRSYEIEPGEQISFHRTSREIHKRKVDLKKYLSWKDGTILLENNTMEDASKVFERWYNVSFEFEDEALKACKVSGEFKNDNLQNILKNIQFLTNFQFTISGDRIIVSGQKCK